MKIQVIYITQNSQFLADTELPKGASVHQAIKQSGLLEKHPDISLENNEVGIFGELVTGQTILNENDRVEVYRPLMMDPMQARRLRAKV